MEGGDALPATERHGSQNRRPQSQDSSTSTRSVTTQPNLDQNFLELEMYARQFQGHPSQDPRHHMNAQHMGNPEAMLMQATRHMQVAPNDFNSSMSARMSQPPALHQNQVMPHGLPTWDDSNLSLMDNGVMAGEDGQGVNGNRKAPRKDKKRRSTANSDGELRELFETNRGRSLEEVSNELRGNERGPKAERKRQLYAMLWLDAACCESKNSVPRGRVYHMYASRCSDDRVIVLNPASFGKLVRILFPNLQTRRLGVRGESKYHYVNFDLREHPTTEVDAPAPSQGLSYPKETDMDVSMTSAQPAEESRAGHLPSPADLLEVPATRIPSTDSKGSRSHSRYNVPRLGSQIDWAAPSPKTPLKLSLMTEADKAADLAEPVVLPDITPYLPPQTDPDAAQSLMALYRSHCTSIIESLRYCREKSFFHLYACFHGTLTMPVQRTFAHPKVAAWIEKCDIMLYQRCTRLISHLSHQVIPQRVMGSMRKIAEHLVGHIQESFRGQPEHVLDAKIGPATIFAGILDRMLRVNVSAHAMVREMSNGANRDQMFADWVQKINPRKIAECVPTRGMDDLVKLLVEEMRDLLSPENVSPELDTQLYPAPVDIEYRGNDGRSHLERFERFLLALPQRFPYASHADIAWCVERVGTTIVRDMTLGVVPSYSSWWVVKVFLDEEIWFLAEAGGFLRTEAIREIPAGSQVAAASQDHGRQGSGADTAEAERTQSPQIPAAGSPGQSDRAPFPPKQQKEAPGEAPDLHDDSGIGIRTPDTDYPMDKFTFGPGENAPDLDVDMDDGAALVH